jgi:hypothetical protein
MPAPQNSIRRIQVLPAGGRRWRQPGQLYHEGWHGLPRNAEKAAEWKQRLAGLGDPEARGWLLYQGHR